MSVANLIKKYYAAFNDEDMEPFLALLSDDLVHDVNQGHREIGKQKFREFMENMRVHYRERIEDLVIMSHEVEGRGAAEFVVVGKYLKTAAGLPPAHGQSYRLPMGAFFAVQGGKISRVTHYYNLAQWLKMIQNP